MSVIVSIQEVKRSHRRFEARHAAMVEDVLYRAGVEGVRESKVSPGFRNRSGALLEATEHRVMRSSSGRLLRLKNSKPYAAPIDKGARPHPIKARNKPYLVFYSQKLGHWVRTKSVNHPGNRPYRFLWRGFQKAQRHARTQLKAGMRREAQRFGSR